MDNFLTFTIKEAAAQVGISIATLRNWEKQHLITPNREANGYRTYTFAQINRLQAIKELSQQKFSLPAIKSLLPPEELESTRNPHNSEVSIRMLGEKWRKDRLKKNLSLFEVAKQVGITASYLSKIENAQANASFEILERIASFYGENILYYFNEDPQGSIIVREPLEPIDIGLKGVILKSRSTLPETQLNVMTFYIQPQCGRFESTFHQGEEMIFLVKGELIFTFEGEKPLLLKTGDSLHFPSIKPHLWHNPSTRDVTELFWVYTGTDF